MVILNFYSLFILILVKILSVFGLVMCSCNCSSFNDPFTFKCLYISLNRSQLEHATFIWDHYIYINNLIETVQNTVLRFIGFKCGVEKTPHSGYNNILCF